MATESDHIKLANRCHVTLKYLLADVDNHPEWAVTVAFYKAVHIVEAVFAHEKGWHSNSHSWRLDVLKEQLNYKPIFKPFRTLYSLSRTARYLEDSSGSGSYSSFADRMPSQKIQEKVVNGLLKTVEDNSLRFLSDGSKSSLVRV